MKYHHFFASLAYVGSKQTIICAVLLLATSYTATAAQTQDEQYSFYLAGSCINMNFQRDEFGIILPGQAGPRLKAFCDGPPPVAGVTTNSASGGGAGSSTSSLAEDVAQRRRRAAKHDDSNKDVDAVRDQANNDDFSINGDKASAFVSLRYQREKQDQTHFEGGRRSNLFGVSVGTDYRFTNTAVLGVALKADRLKGTFDSGGDFQTDTTGALLYGSWYPVANLFVDLTAGVDLMSLDTKRMVSFSRTVDSRGFISTVVLLPPTAANSSPDSHASEVELRSGYDVAFDSITVGPRVGIKNRRTRLDAYTEDGATPMTLAVDEQTSTSLISAVGVQLSKAFTPASGVFVTQFNLDWQHEFKNDQRTITARFAEDLRASPEKLQFQNEPPDRDVLVARMSLAAVFKRGFSSFLSVDSLFGHSYLSRYGANIGVRKEF